MVDIPTWHRAHNSIYVYQEYDTFAAPRQFRARDSPRSKSLKERSKYKNLPAKPAKIENSPPRKQVVKDRNKSNNKKLNNIVEYWEHNFRVLFLMHDESADFWVKRRRSQYG